MAKYHKPRAGSTGFSPRVRAKKETPSIGNYADSDEAAPLGFLCYKAGMTHVLAKDLDKNSPTHNLDVQIPVTVLECPPLTVIGIRAYVEGYDGLEVLTDALAEKPGKDLARAMPVPKDPKTAEKLKKIEDSLEEVAKVVLLVATQPRKAGAGKKKPDVIELAVGGSVKEQLDYAKSVLGKDIRAGDVFSEADMVDAIAVTKGKGFQGPVKRWGIKMQKRKAKRTPHTRHVGSIGGWNPSNLSWLTPMAGQTGYQKRVDFNKFIVKMGEKGEEATPEGGFVGYGVVPGEYILIKGSVPGPKKRAVALRKAIRQPTDLPSLSVDRIAVESQQGV